MGKKQYLIVIILTQHASFQVQNVVFYFDGNYSGIQRVINNCKIYPMEEKSTTKKIEEKIK